mgnify:CR=1 FL=1
MKNRIIILLVGLMLLPVMAMAQRVVTGTVVDANNEQPLVGASLYWKNTTAGATTSVDGTFSIRRVSGFETLVVDYLGYDIVELEMNDKNVKTETIAADKTSYANKTEGVYAALNVADNNGMINVYGGSFYKQNPAAPGTEPAAWNAAHANGFVAEGYFATLIGDYYVRFDVEYKAQIKELMAQGMDEETAKKEAPLIKEAQAMLVKWEQNDPEVRALWQKMNEWVYAGFDETYKQMGVGFDKIYYESDTYLVGKGEVERGLAKGDFYRREDGSVWADLAQNGLDEKLLLRADGTSVYMTQDIGTAKLRFEDYPIDKMVYVVGNEQEYHFKVLSILLDRLGFPFGKELVHFSYGMVELPNGKMKSREGTVVDADDLMAQMIADAKEISKDKVNTLPDITEEEANEIARMVGLGALKYFILKVDPRKNMLFNPEESIDFNGNTGPFIQYTYARIQSVLRKAEEHIDSRLSNPESTTLSEKELALIQRLVDYPAAVRQAGDEFSPAVIANYAYALACDFNSFYHDHSILNEADADKRVLRLVLAQNVAKVIKSAMALLGIEVPNRM